MQEVDDDGDLHVVAACLGAHGVDLVMVAVDRGDPVAAGGVAAGCLDDDPSDARRRRLREHEAKLVLGRQIAPLEAR